MLETYFPECKKVSCPLRLSCGRSPTVVQRSPFAKETDPVDILFVSDHPNSREMKSRRPFSGPEKDIIHRIVTGVDEELSYAFT